MKKKFTAFIIAAVLCLACVPLFAGCSAKTVYTLKEDEAGNKYYVASFSGFPSGLKGELVIPEERDGIPVTEIATEGFAGTSITSVTIPKSVTKIGAAAFAYNYSLQKVTFDEGCVITEISQGLFGYCNSLKEISMPSTVEKIGPMAFINCTGLDSVSLSENVTLIGAQAFAGCTALTEITLPQKLITIGEQAFYTSGLTGIVIPDSVKDVETEVLDENGQPKLDDKGNKVMKTTYGIGMGAFHTCTDMKYAVVGKRVQTLRSGAFGYCPAMEKLYLPKSVEGIEGIYVEDGKVIYKHAFHHNGALTEVYYEGTEEEWQALLKKVNNDTVKVKGDSEQYDNSALFNAHINYGQAGLPE
ncbi:MAG: leucine-rich repeat domain-containing protein [Clostridia bacterium]|nr:leucine-rich repeat domain-containing protein [Clostridia bacterium]